MRVMMRIGLVLLLLCPACSADTKEKHRRVRSPALAGTWYPDGRTELEHTVDRFLADAEKARLKGRLIALIAPHAGYAWSGETAGHTFRQIGGEQFRRVIVLAPTHYGNFRGFSIMDVDAYATPLGEVALDRDLCRDLAEHDLHVKADALHSREHAIEIELPFLQRCLKEFKLVPILVGSLSADDAKEIADALRPYVSAEKTLIVVSSDFTHYGRRFGYVPFTDNVEENIRKLDMNAVKLILKKDSAGFEAHLKKTGATICGRNAIAILLHLLPENAEGQLLKYDTSGRKTRDFANSVSYVSVAFSPAGDDGLSLEEKKTLLRIAREAIEENLSAGGRPVALDVSDASRFAPSLKAKAGAFVTLKKHGRLRGCIGRIGYPEIADSIPPLYRTVTLMAVQAARHDHRFRPVRQEEMKEIKIEISVLTIAKEVSGADDFQVGKHGIIIRKGERSAVFLPQVAPEQGWDRADTLRHLCRKAGLRVDEWKEPGMKFFVFTAQVFDETLLQKTGD